MSWHYQLDKGNWPEGKMLLQIPPYISYFRLEIRLTHHLLGQTGNNTFSPIKGPRKNNFTILRSKFSTIN
jgi:hypothetical protein